MFRAEEGCNSKPVEHKNQTVEDVKVSLQSSIKAHIGGNSKQSNRESTKESTQENMEDNISKNNSNVSHHCTNRKLPLSPNCNLKQVIKNNTCKQQPKNYNNSNLTISKNKGKENIPLQSGNESGTKSQQMNECKLNSKTAHKPQADFYEYEKDDIEHPDWEAVKKLKTNEERYKQVRDCWKLKSIPNPNKNLTYHSYRKQRLQAGKLNFRHIKPTKRKATSQYFNLETKRPRLCTYMIDQQIESIKSEEALETKNLRNYMNEQLISLETHFSEQEQALHNFYGYYAHNYHYQDFINLQMQYQQRLRNIKGKMYGEIQSCNAKYKSKIDALKKVREEILQFCNFYKGFNEEDPTIITDTQLQELNEIEDIYEKFKKYYK